VACLTEPFDASDLSEAELRVAAAKRETQQTRMRLLLLIGIAGVLASTFWLKHKMGERDAQTVGRLDDPSHRALTALAEADSAVISKDLPGVWLKLRRARSALDDGLATRPNDVALLRSRIVVLRRLANAGNRLGKPEARGLFEEALTYSRALFDQDRNDPRARVDLLKAARELGTFRMAHDDAAGAAGALSGAAEAIEEAHVILPARASVLALLASTWTDAAQAHAKAEATIDARAALRQAAKHAEDATLGGKDPVSALASAAGLVGRAAQVAYRLKVPEALKLAQRAVVLLEQQRALTPENRSFDSSLAQWHGRVAELHAEAGRDVDALASYEAAIATRLALTKRFAKEDALKADLVRAVNRLGAFHSAAGRNDKAIAAYAEAVKLARTALDHQRVLLIALGNHAHVLGRIDRMVESKAAAAEAYTLALARLKGEEPGRRAQLDASVAGLRHARLLRAKPRPKRREARTVAQTEKARLDALPGKKTGLPTQLRTELDRLLDELK
jgi:tetratricopeptide (TPR) repeat protein